MATGDITIGSTTNIISSDNVSSPQVMWLDNTHVAVAYIKLTSSDAYARVGTVSGNSISWGTEKLIMNFSGTMATNSTSDNFIARKLSSTSFIVAGKESSSYKKLFGVVCTVSGTTISNGTVTQLTVSGSATSNYDPSISVLSSTKVVFTWTDSITSGGTTYYIKSRVLDISGTSISTNTIYNVPGNVNGNANRTKSYELTDSKIVIANTNGSSYSDTVFTIGEISGNVITYGSQYSSGIGGYPNYSQLTALSNNTFVYAGEKTYGKMVAGTVSGTVISMGSVTTLNTGSTDYLVIDSLDDKSFITFYEDDSLNGEYVTSCSVSGNTITKNTPKLLGVSGALYLGIGGYDSQTAALIYTVYGSVYGSTRILAIEAVISDYEYTPTGGLVTLGSGTVEIDYITTGSGIVTSSGLASVEIGYITTGSGLVQTSGAADTQGENSAYVGSGDIYTSGEASTYTVSPLRIGYPMVLTGTDILGVENLDDTHVAYLYSDDNGSYINIATYNGNAELEYAALSYSVPQSTAYRYKISALSATKLLVSYFITGEGIYTVIADIAGTAVTFGDEWLVPTSDQTNPHDIHELSDDTFVVTFRDYNIDETVVSKGAVTGTDISFGNFEYSTSSVSTEWVDIVKISSISIVLIESPVSGNSQATYISLIGTPTFYLSPYIPNSNNRVSGFGLNNGLQYVLFYNNYSNDNVSVIGTLTSFTSSFGTQYPTGYNYYNSFDITKLDGKLFALGFRESDNSAATLIGEIDDDVITYDHYTKYSDTLGSVFTTKLDSRKYVLSNEFYPPTVGHSLDSYVAVLDGTFITPCYVGSGTITTSGSAAGQADFIVVGSGLIQTSGSAALYIDKYYDGSGVVNTSGNASVEVHYITTGSGVVQSSGSATAQIDYSYSGSGVVQTLGTALVELESIYAGSGLVQTSGQVITQSDKITTGSGVIQSSGNADISIDKYYEGSGVVETSGEANTIYDVVHEYTTTGGIVTSGAAITGWDLPENAIDWWDADLTLGTNKYNIASAPLSSDEFVTCYTSGSSAFSRIGTVNDISKDISYSNIALFSSIDIVKLDVKALDENNFIIGYRNVSGGKGYVVHGSRDINNDITYGTPVEIDSSVTYHRYINLLVIDNLTFVVSIDHENDSRKGFSYIGTVSGNSITLTSGFEFFGGTGSLADYVSSVKIDSNRFLIAHDEGDNFYNGIKIGTITGNTLSFGIEYGITLERTNYLTIDMLSSDKFIVSYQADQDDDQGKAKIGTITGSVLSFGNEYIYNSNRTLFNSAAVLDEEHIIFTHRDIDAGVSNGVIGIVQPDESLLFGEPYEMWPSGVINNAVHHMEGTRFLSTYSGLTGYYGVNQIGEGSIPYIKEYDGSGTITTSGEADTSFQYVYAGQGTVQTSGEAEIIVDRIIVGSGLIQTSGSVNTEVNVITTGSGVIQTSGSVQTELNIEYIASGGIEISGTAPVIFEPWVIGSGTIQVSGSAPVFIEIYEYYGSGLVQTGGSAQIDVDTFVYDGSGTIQVSGHAIAILEPYSREVIVVGSFLTTEVTVESYINTSISIEGVVNRKISAESYL